MPANEPKERTQTAPGAPQGGPPREGPPVGGPPEEGAPQAGPPGGGTPQEGPPLEGSPEEGASAVLGTLTEGAPHEGAPQGEGAPAAAGAPQEGAPQGEGAPAAAGYPIAPGAPTDGASIENGPAGGAPMEGAPIRGAPNEGAPIGGPLIRGAPVVGDHLNGGPSKEGPPVGVLWNGKEEKKEKEKKGKHTSAAEALELEEAAAAAPTDPAAAAAAPAAASAAAAAEDSPGANLAAISAAVEDPAADGYEAAAAASAAAAAAAVGEPDAAANGGAAAAAAAAGKAAAGQFVGPPRGRWKRRGGPTAAAAAAAADTAAAAADTAAAEDEAAAGAASGRFKRRREASQAPGSLRGCSSGCSSSRSSSRSSNNNERMHPRSRFFGGPLDFAELSKRAPFLSPFLSFSSSGKVFFDFKSKEAQLALCAALFRCMYSLAFTLPSTQDFLIPTLPNRSNYIHFLADLLSPEEGLGAPRGPPIPGGEQFLLRGPPAQGGPQGGPPRGPPRAARPGGPPQESPQGSPQGAPQGPPLGNSPGAPQGAAQGAPKGGPQGDPQGAPGGAPEGYVGPPRGGGVRIWDVGVGANCVYPLLGFADYGWRFVGSDISEESLAAAAANLHANGLEVYVQLRLQQQPQQIFEGVLRDEDGLFAACVCNPPFYSSPELVAKSPWREKAGKLHELACAGGEAAFLRCMYTESKAHAARFLWFTSLVARTSTRDELKRQIQHGMRLAGRRAEQQMEAEAQRWLRRHRLQRGQSCSSSSSSSGGGGGSCSSSSSSSGSCSGAEEVEMHPRELRVFDLFQGKQTRWVVCWTYWTAAQRRQLREILYSDSAG